jgi:Gluconate 2-dehydrogenase subunit 3
MNRRAVLKNLVLASGSLVALPAWAQEWSAGTITVNHSIFSITEQELLASVADTIIPAGNSIGALSVGVDKFLQRLFADCYDKPVQDNIKVQLTALDSAAQQAYGKSFATCDAVQRKEAFLKFSTSTKREENDFFNLLKSETIRGFSTSKDVMVKYQGYKVAPGHYYGCVPVKA